MNRSTLFDEVKSWLEAEQLAFIANDEEADFEVRMNLETGLFQIRLLCEESPATLQVMCALPVKVPKEKIPAAGLLLHNLNLRLRMGAFHLVQDERVVTFRLAFPIRTDSDLRNQFSEAFGIALSTMEDKLQPLALFLCSTEEARSVVAKLASAEESLGETSRLPLGRLKFN